MTDLGRVVAGWRGGAQPRGPVSGVQTTAMYRLQWSCWETQLLSQPWYNTVLL